MSTIQKVQQKVEELVKENAELKEQQRKYATFVKVGFIFYIKLQ
jgi:FtsZ-binding cell division protein ZapB